MESGPKTDRLDSSGLGISCGHLRLTDWIALDLVSVADTKTDRLDSSGLGISCRH